MGAMAGIVSLTMILGALPTLPASPPSPGPAEQERFIVVLEEGFSPRAIAQQALEATGGRIGFLYEHSVQGFMIEIPAPAVNGLRNMPGVAFIEPDVTVRTAAQVESTGYDRIDADLNPGGSDYSGVDIAIIDTGIWYVPNAGEVHEDLNLVWVADCTAAFFYPLFGGCVGGGVDGNGHGTHVAGIAAACDNGIGTLGTAPCATLWSLKALGDDGTGSLGSVLAAVDLVAANADQIEVANMSLSFQGESQALTDAIDAAVAAGVAFVVAAGNSSVDAALHSPASVESAVTVSSVTDYDGATGGLATETCYPDSDDSLAAYSNFGPRVDIAAPGTCIYSTHLSHGYATYSGTSMAAPTVAGAVARYFHDNGIDPTSAADVQAARDALVAGGIDQNDACGFSGDTDGFAEPLLFLNGPAFGGDGTCGDGGTPPPNSPPTAVIAEPVDCTGLSCTFDGSGSGDDNGIATYAWDFGDVNTGTGVTPTHIYVTAGTYTVELTVTSNDGGTDTTTVSVLVEAPPVNQPPTAVIVEPVDCTDLTCTFDGSGSGDDSGIATYAWDFGDGNTTTGVAPTHAYATAGTYSVGLTVTSNDGGTDSTAVSVTVTESSGPTQMTTAVAGFTYDGTWASVSLWVLEVPSAVGVAGAEVEGEWTYTDRRGRLRTKAVTGTSDDSGLVTIRNRFKNVTPTEFCVVDITKPGYTYVPSPIAGQHCGGLLASAGLEAE
ncbi:MAG: S8 family serine peptidase [Acidimicrobiia bacterium]|nr:S8 family serine peptidase [Acidimicrobiia bacterium]MBT8218162.1 S8 family serine peptidase [Acidimicrobiia bacterium]NNL70896.1 S8 family serine peptidase [Acidimicrobiia bacterium]